MPLTFPQDNGRDLFRLTALALCIGQMLVYYDTATKSIPRINEYLLANLFMFHYVLARAPGIGGQGSRTGTQR